MKINSKDLWNYINDLTTNEKVKFNVYYDDNYVTQIYWNGDNFEWEPGRFTSEAFFNPIYDFEPIKEKEEKKIPEKLNKNYNIRIFDLDKPYTIKDYDVEQLIEMVQDIYEKQGEICDYLKSKGE